MKRTTPQPKEAQNTEPNVAHDISSVSEKIRRKRKQSGVRRARKKRRGDRIPRTKRTTPQPKEVQNLE